MIKGILFDKDGTLIEFTNVWYEIIGRIFETLEVDYQISQATIKKIKMVSGYQEDGFEKESIIQYSSTYQIVDIWNKMICEEQVGEQGSITYSELLKLFEEKAIGKDLEIHAIEGVTEMLGYLKDKGYSLGVATADTEIPTKYGLEKAKIINFFDYIGCTKEGIQPKPSPDMAHHFCLDRNLLLQEILIVGDSVTDMQFADNAGANFVGIKTPYNQCEEFEKYGKWTVDNIVDIISLFEL